MTALDQQAQSPFNPATDRVGRVLCFAAHPDDIDFGAAGTIAAWTAAGVEVSYCIMTDGDAGGFDPAHRADIIALRDAEQRRAAKLVGVTDIHYLHQRDGYLEPSHEVMKEVVQPDGTVKRVYIYTPHSLRATAATLLLGARTDIKKVQELLGHSQVTTTQIYDKRHFLYLRRREP